jgi:hypothetical protein
MKHPDGAAARAALADSVLLAVACLVSYLLVSNVLARVHSVSPDDDLLGGMWAVLATIFVNRSSLRESRTAAVSRVAATLVSFVYCLIYLAFLPFHPWALAVQKCSPLAFRSNSAPTRSATTAVCASGV